MEETIVLGGGCFWCTEAIFGELKGIKEVMPGYAGGSLSSPTYEQVSAGGTGHAEVIRVVFYPDVISLHDLLVVFFTTHDPTTLDRQGNDVGSQYRSILFYTTEKQKVEIENTIALLQKEFGERKIITEVRSLETFYEAEDYHRQYFEKHMAAPYCSAVIDPKLKKLRQEFKNILKEQQK